MSEMDTHDLLNEAKKRLDKKAHWPGKGPAPREREITAQFDGLADFDLPRAPSVSLSDDEIGALLKGPARAMVEERAGVKAAPEMLEALEEIKRLLATAYVTGSIALARVERAWEAFADAEMLADAAIAKAKGETP